MSSTDPQHFKYVHHLRSASSSLFDACVDLTAFTSAMSLWAEIAAERPETGQPLADRCDAIAQTLETIKHVNLTLQGHRALFETEWRAHRAAMEREPRPHAVTGDHRISTALAQRLTDAGGDAVAIAAISDTLAALGLDPAGPTWASWALENRHGHLYWVPYLPPEPEAAPPLWPRPLTEDPWSEGAGAPGPVLPGDSDTALSEEATA